MFPGEPARDRRETSAEQARRRAREGRDRRALKQVAVALALLFGSMASLVALDVAGVERRTTQATVVGFTVNRYVRGGYECVTHLLTGFGYAKIYTRNECRYAPWRIGDTAQVAAKQSRLTQTVVVDTRGTIFQQAYSALPAS